MHCPLSDFEIHVLHGFLGLPSDWQSVFSDSKHSYFFHSLSDHAFTTEDPFDSWVNAFLAHVNSMQSQKPKILVGYSLGGRLALHCLKKKPNLWSGGVLISTNPGLESTQEQEQRLKSDEQWAHLFEVGEWEHVVSQWNKQGVFSHEPFFAMRKENQFSRSLLAKQLRFFSVARQQNFRPFLKKIPIPLLWVTGQKDTKFQAIQTQIQQLSNLNISCVSVANAAHRVPWENTAEFVLKCHAFLEKIRIKNEHRNMD